MLDMLTLERLAVNPNRGIGIVINDVERTVLNGEAQINSLAHPAVMCLDVIIGTASGFHNRLSDGISKTFAVHARNLDDLSRNMSDEERIGIIGEPSSTVFQFILDTQDVINFGVDFQENIGQQSSISYKKLLLPKDTEIVVSGYTFAIENGIEIRYNDRTGYQVVYDSTTSNPFSPISSNVLERRTLDLKGKRYLVIEVPVRQLKAMATANINSNVSSGARGEVVYEDFLYGVRAFFTPVGIGSVQREITVSYNQDVFDPADLTLALKLDTTNNKYKYEIPDVYVSNGLGVGSLTIYTYVTKGELSKNFADTPSNEFQPNLQDYRYGPGQLNQYSSAFRQMGGIGWRCQTPVSGGGNPTPFEDIKQDVINGRRQRQLPITENNLSGRVESFGYSSVKTIDYVTSRSYSITRELPVQNLDTMSSGMGCYVGSHLTSVNDLKSAGVIFDNGRRVTVPHNILFDITDPTTRLVTQIETDSYNRMSKEAKVDLTDDKSLVYTPFYYVFDLTNDQVTLRTYHLDEPAFGYQTFDKENTSLGLEVGIGAVNIINNGKGYTIRVQTKSGRGYQELADESVGLQLSINPRDSASTASIAGKLIAKKDSERIFEFTLDSTYDVDVNNVIYFSNFNQFGKPSDSVGSDLATDLTFIFTTAGDNSPAYTDSDNKIDQTLFKMPMIAIIETSYSVTFGKLMANMYSRVRPLAGLSQYKRYEHNVPAVYDRDMYKRNPDESLVLGPDKKPILEHKIGDPIYSDSGAPVFQYMKNDYMKDENGNNIEVAPRDLRYHWDFIGFDGVYYFADNEDDKRFAQQTKDYFVGTISIDMSKFMDFALDRTMLYFQPRNKLGHQEVVINNNNEAVVKQDLSFVVTYYLTRNGNRNDLLKESLNDTTAKVINNVLYRATTVGTSDVLDALRSNVPSDVLDVKVSAFSGSGGVDVVSSVDDLNGFCVRKGLELANDGVLGVKEKVDIVFLEHTTDRVN